MSTALYRRYRPETFAEVIGQEHVTEPLSTALTNDRINHAYLFSGPRGCGKTSSARILARCLNCEQGPTPTPCGVCESCVGLARGGPGTLDVVEIDAASHGGVEDARDLRERAVFAPARDRYKVFVIDEAHMVSPQGFNALLKLVEEPPEHVRFIFATTEPEKVIGTIRSRTHHYPFRLVPPERLQAYLGELCVQEGVAVGTGVLPLVVRAGAGSVRDSLSVLDQLIAGAGPEGLDYARAVSLLGFTDATLLDDVIDALAASDGGTVFTVVDRVIQTGHDPRRFVEDLLERLRDLLVVTAVRDRAGAVLRGLPEDQLARMENQAARFGASELSRAADVVNAALTEMIGATSPRLQLELLCARLLLPDAEDAERGVRARVDRLERRIGMAGGDMSGVPHTAPTPRSAPAPHASPVRHPAPSPQAAPTPQAAPVTAPRPTSVPPASAPISSSSTSAPSAPAPEPSARAAWPASASSPAQLPAAAPTSAAESGVVHVEMPEEPDGVRTPPSDVPPVEPTPTVAKPMVAPVVRAEEAPGPGTPGAMDVETIRRRWPEVLEALTQLKRATWSLMSQHGQVLDWTGDRLVIGFGSAGLAGSFSRGAHREFLRQALIVVLGLDGQIDAVVGDRPPSRDGAQASPVARVATGQGAAEWTPTAPPLAPAAPEPQEAPVTRQGAARPDSTRPGRGRPTTTAPPDIPLPDEPPPDDEDAPFPDAGSGSRNGGGARRPAKTSVAIPDTATVGGPSPAQWAAKPAPGDDVPSRDDADADGSNLVGAAVVEQLLGGRVIEDRADVP